MSLVFQIQMEIKFNMNYVEYRIVKYHFTRLLFEWIIFTGLLFGNRWFCLSSLLQG
jgi:hypothetical protein